MTNLKRLTGILVITSIFVGGLQAQSRNEAVEAYNQGVGLMKTDVPGAISSFEKSIQISDQVGDSAADLKQKAVAVLPDLYYQLAYKSYTDKNIPGAISASKATISVAEKYQNDKTKERGVTLLTQLYMSQGSTFFKANENDKAIAAFDSALLVNPGYTKALLNKAQVYAKMENDALFTENIDKFIEQSSSDQAQVDQAKKFALSYFKADGSKANVAKKYDEALGYLNQSTKYGEDKDVYYQMAKAYNGLKNYDDAIANAEKGLALETGDAAAKAKFYYEMAVAQAAKNDKENACANFKNASYGQFAAASKAQITNLKCSAAPAK